MTTRSRIKLDRQPEQSPLQWPEGWQRTRLQDRQSRSAWKRSYSQAVTMLERELSLLGATSYCITRNDTTSEDSGVAVYFSLKAQDQYGWQEALGFIGEVPTVQQIDRAYMERVRRVHPDGPTPDSVLFHELTKHRDNARAFVRGARQVEHEKVMSIDAFKEQRWNITAVYLVIRALRQIERCGSPVMMDRAFRGFSKALITEGAKVKETRDATAVPA